MDVAMKMVNVIPSFAGQAIIVVRPPGEPGEYYFGIDGHSQNMAGLTLNEGTIMSFDSNYIVFLANKQFVEGFNPSIGDYYVPTDINNENQYETGCVFGPEAFEESN